MKFLCDRCKTRYSIGDDRVRGKILKIRCKNCANVITVREGMTDADVADAAPARRSKPTTMSPPVVTSSPAIGPGAAPAGALGAAFASAMTKPPPALEEEWYVSIDGDQSGPYSLAEAQRWIGAKAYDADLHCWSEGFDDWLPVDKVSHFRGLRKKPAPPAGPPPLPRATGALPALRAQARPGSAIEEEPKPLFAATMASLEKGAAAAAAGMGMPSAAANGAARPSATPPGGQSRYPSPISGTPAIPSIQARTNGTGPSPKLGSSTGPAPKLPSALPLPSPGGSPAKIASKSGPLPRLDSKPANPFDVGDQPTQIEAPPFEGEVQTKAEPVASQAKRTASEANDVFARSAEPAKAAVAPRLANAPITPTTDSDDDEGDDLSFGEVSRVVNLADLAKSAKRPEKKTEPQPALAAAVLQRRSAGISKLNATAPVVRIDDPLSPNSIAADPSAIPGTEMAMQPAPPAESHKRGMIILLGVSALLLTGVIIAVVMLASEDTIEKGLGRSDKIDTTRPDDPLRPTKPGDVAGTGSANNPFFPQKNPVKRPNPNPTPNNQVVNGGSGKDPTELPTADSLSPEDIDAVSKKYSTGTQRCYMRAQKGADAITIGNVKSIQATLTVAKDGSVTDVLLASNADNNLGKCLNNALRGWRFRANPGGRVKFTLAFAAQ